MNTNEFNDKQIEIFTKYGLIEMELVEAEAAKNQDYVEVKEIFNSLHRGLYTFEKRSFVFSKLGIDKQEKIFEKMYKEFLEALDFYEETGLHYDPDNVLTYAKHLMVILSVFNTESSYDSYEPNLNELIEIGNNMKSYDKILQPLNDFIDNEYEKAGERLSKQAESFCKIMEAKNKIDEVYGKIMYGDTESIKED